MGLKVGIIGLPNVGKSTLFNAIMGKQAALTAPYPFATIEPNVGVVDVPDERLVKLKEAMFPASDVPIVPATVTFVDIAGLVKGASEGNGLGNKFLSHIRDVDLILHVLRDFEAEGIPRHQDSRDPEHDAEIVETELGLKDLELKEKNPEYSDYLAKKPTIYAVNVGEEKLQNILTCYQSSVVGYQSQVSQFSVSQSITGELKTGKPESENRKQRTDNRISFCAKIEEEISQLSKNEQKEYLKVYGLETSGLDRIITECFHRLGLISFFTGGKIEVKAWPIKKGSTAPQAAGTIHSDFEKLFIRAETIEWEKLGEAGSWPAAKEKGWVRIEGRNYLIKDGDVCNFLVGK